MNKNIHKQNNLPVYVMYSKRFNIQFNGSGYVQFAGSAAFLRLHFEDIDT